MSEKLERGMDDSKDSITSRGVWENSRSISVSARILRLIHGMPRVVWLTTSAVILITGSAAWHFHQPQWSVGEGHEPRQATRLLSLDWWTRPSVRDAGSALPEISARLYGVAIETASQGHRSRVWVVGTGGFLAYSDDDGRCWAQFEYKVERAEFLKLKKQNTCESASQTAQFRWLELAPTVFAAPLSQSRSPEQQQSPARQGQPRDGARTTGSPSESTGVQQKVTVFPTAISFGDVQLPPPQSATSALDSREFTVTNPAKYPIKVFISGFNGDTYGEFSLKPTPSCGSNVVPPAGDCSFAVFFSPRKAGKKQVGLDVQTSVSQSFVITIDAIAHIPNEASSSSQQGNPPGRQNNTEAPTVRESTKPNLVAALKPPANPPDLLGIEFSPSGKIVSTGGLLWRFTSDNTWFLEHVPRDHKERVANIEWLLSGPSSGKWATETWIENPQMLSRPRDRYGCSDCTIRAEVSGDSGSSSWAVGWATDAFGDHGIIFRSEDSGRSWTAMSRGALSVTERAAVTNKRPWMWPPNWYWAVVFLSIAAALPALLPPPARSDPIESQTGSVEGRLSSDKPLDPGDLDVLGLTGIALGLSRFLRNEKTLPPLTVAVNGEWGSGKSSLMNLLRCDLESYGMRPVWFNAWHHQKEEHLLAALLQNVRLEAVPPLWSLLGVPFRLRLLCYRLHRSWPVLILSAGVLIFLIVLDYHLRSHDHSDLFLWVISQLFQSSGTEATGPVSNVPLHGGIVALLVGVAALSKGLTALGANPAALLASVAKGNRMKDLEAQTSFRQKFAVEFHDFTCALGSRRPLVVFVDDLDRCLPENVRDVLEAVNFLVSSGDCFVILGIDREAVQRAIGLSFKEVAEEIGPKHEAVSANVSFQLPVEAEASREKRAEFAQKYLEKLINLEVRVPQAVDEATKQRLFERTPEKEAETGMARALLLLLQVSKWAVPGALAASLLVGASQLSVIAVPAVERWMTEKPSEPPPGTSGSQQNTGLSYDENVLKGENSADPRSYDAVLGRSRGPITASDGELISPISGSGSTITPGKPIWPALWVLSLPMYMAGLFILLVANVVLTARPGIVTHDSPQFSDAMEKVWYPVVLAKQSTPRAAKRFVNRVRYLAMRQRGYQEQASMWERVLFPGRLREPARTENWQPIPEPLLVALAAVEQMQPQWIYDEAAFKHVAGENGIAELIGKFPANLPTAATLLEKARAKHLETFSDPTYEQKQADWESLPIYRERFLEIWPPTLGETG